MYTDYDLQVLLWCIFIGGIISLAYIGMATTVKEGLEGNSTCNATCACLINVNRECINYHPIPRAQVLLVPSTTVASPILHARPLRRVHLGDNLNLIINNYCVKVNTANKTNVVIQFHSQIV